MCPKLLCSLTALFALAGSPACGNCGPDNAQRGSTSITWSINILHDLTATCAQAGATSVSLLLHDHASGADTHATFACTDSAGTTSAVRAGAYDATLSLHAADGATLATAPTQSGIAITAGQVTKLAPVDFTISGRGPLSFSLATLATSSNCMARDRGGAGITGTTITIERASGGCAALTFVRSRGTTPVGTYTINCSSPQVASCIERDETLTFENFGSGPYVIRVTGLAGTIRCWAGDDVFVMPSGATFVKPIQLAPQPAAGC